MSNEQQSTGAVRAANGLVHIGNAGEIWTPSCSLMSLLCRAGRAAAKPLRLTPRSAPTPVSALATDAA